MRMEQIERPQYDNYIAGNKLQNSVYDKDLGVSSLTCHLILKRIASKYMDKEILSKLFISYVRPKLEYASHILSAFKEAQS